MPNAKEREAFQYMKIKNSYTFYFLWKFGWTSQRYTAELKINEIVSPGV